MQHGHHSIRIVDNLAEITSHQDRHVLEKSLLKTLSELYPETELQLFRVKHLDEQIDIHLLAYSVNDLIVSTDENPRLNAQAQSLTQAMSDTIDKADISVIQNEESDCCKVLYPAFDAQGEIFGMLVHECTQAPEFSDQRLVYGILKVYANYLALIDKSQRDKLTGLYNRETLDDEITKILVRESRFFQTRTPGGQEARRRYADKYWLGLVDIDYFKPINDRYGHLYGDEVIILVARLMTSGCLRDEDRVYRYGGEEFVVLLKASDENNASKAFERIRQMISAHPFPQLDQVTVSVGMVEVEAQSSSSDAIGQADDALYYAKEHGRNQVRSYQRLVEDGELAQTDTNDHADVELF